jgi:hypothetical protein
MNRFAKTGTALITTLHLFALGACSAPPESSDEPIERVTAALTTPAQVMGFEDPALWSATQGVKSASTDHIQGTQALGIKTFVFTALTSVPLATLSGVTSTLQLDVKPPAAPAWGQVQLFVSIPSRNINNLPLNAVSIVNYPSTQYTTLSYAIPSNIVTALKQSYTDLTFGITINAPQTDQNFLLDNLRFSTAATASSLVEIQAANVDDLLTITVNQIRRKVWRINGPDLNQRIDISSWFGAGNNTIRIQNANTGGPAGYQFQLWVDGQQVINDSAAIDPALVAIAVDKTLTVNTPNRPAFRTVSLTSSTPGPVYVDSVYIGSSTPLNNLTMPQGSYKLGLGVSQDTPPNYTGSFYEQTVTVGATQPTSINLTSGSPLPLQKTNSVVVIPIRDTYNYVTALGRPDVSNASTLLPADVAALTPQITATRDAWFKPFTYGLATWNVTTLPMVTNVPLLEVSPDNVDLDGFLVSAGLTGLKQQYDRIVFYYSQQRADGTDVVDPIGFVFALGRQYVGFQASYTRIVAPGLPSPYILHEFMHNHEAYNFDVLGLYNGIAGLHGAGQHGYQGEGSSGETDFVKFYRRYLRSQIAELDGMNIDTQWPSIPTTADMWLGLFQTVRVYTGK